MQLYLVGGCVRDILLGIEPKDVDYVVIGSTPEEMIQLGYKPIEATSFPVFHDDKGDEYSLARKERKTGNGYHGFDVDYDSTITLIEDLFRRDLTINGMAITIEAYNKYLDLGKDIQFFNEHVIDFFNGKTHLDFGILKHVSHHFSEDPVRVLRLFRFASRYGFIIHTDTEEYVRVMVRNGELNHLTPERILLEFKKVFESGRLISQFYHLMSDFNIWDCIGVNEEKLCIDYEALDSINMVVDKDKNALYGLLNLFLNAHEDYIIDLKEVLKFDNHFMNTYTFIKRLKSTDNFLTLDSAVELLKLFKGFKNKKSAINDALTFFEYIGDNHMVKTTNKIISAFNEMNEVKFDSLTYEEQEKLKGEAIGEAIDALRVQICKNLFNIQVKYE